MSIGSFADADVVAVGVVTSNTFTAPRAAEGFTCIVFKSWCVAVGA